MTARPQGPIRLSVAAHTLGALLLVACGDSTSEPTPRTTPTPAQDNWFAFVGQCSNCPGLTNAVIDRSSVPYRARLRVGQRSSLRAAVRFSCEPEQVPLDVTRWIVGNPQAITVQPSSTESAIVTAVAPGISTIHGRAPIRRRHAESDQKSLKDGQDTSGCGLLPDLVFEIVP
jgi:hypothetical protein